MDEIRNLLVENNLMLRYICNYIFKLDSRSYQNTQDFKGLMSNLVSDLYLANI